MANRYSVLLEFFENSNSHLVFKFDGKIKFITVTYLKGALNFYVFKRYQVIFHRFKNVFQIFLMVGLFCHCKKRLNNGLNAKEGTFSNISFDFMGFRYANGWCSQSSARSRGIFPK